MRASTRTLFLYLSLFCLPGAAFGQQKVRVVTKPVEPFSFTQNANLAGFSIDLWEAVAKEAGFQSDVRSVQTVPQMLDTLKAREADVSIAAISITAERHAFMDFSQPYYDSGLQILVATNAQRSGSLTANLARTFFNWTSFRAVGTLLLAMLPTPHS